MRKENGGELVSTEAMRHQPHAEVPPTSLIRWTTTNCRTFSSRRLITGQPFPGLTPAGFGERQPVGWQTGFASEPGSEISARLACRHPFSSGAGRREQGRE